jgi:hypothetical protein
MRRLLSSEQRRHVEELAQEKGETCGVCGGVILRCDEDAYSYPGGGYGVRLRCTNPTDDEGHGGGGGGFGLAWEYSLSSEEARRVDLN